MGLYHHFQIAIAFTKLILPHNFKCSYVYLKQLYKTPVKKDLTGIILFRSYEHFKFYIILCIFRILIILYN